MSSPAACRGDSRNRENGNGYWPSNNKPAMLDPEVPELDQLGLGPRRPHCLNKFEERLGIRFCRAMSSTPAEPEMPRTFIFLSFSGHSFRFEDGAFPDFPEPGQFWRPL